MALTHLWLCSSSPVRSQTLGRESSSAAVFMAAVRPHTSSTNMRLKLEGFSEKLQQGDQQSRKQSDTIQKEKFDSIE